MFYVKECVDRKGLFFDKYVTSIFNIKIFYLFFYFKNNCFTEKC